MAEPPRLSEIVLPAETEVIYFVTRGIDRRRPVLANSHTGIGRGGSPNRPRAIGVNRPYLSCLEYEGRPLKTSPTKA